MTLTNRIAHATAFGPFETHAGLATQGPCVRTTGSPTNKLTQREFPNPQVTMVLGLWPTTKWTTSLVSRSRSTIHSNEPTRFAQEVVA